jgi:hypothetical protein
MAARRVSIAGSAVSLVLAMAAAGCASKGPNVVVLPHAWNATDYGNYGSHATAIPSQGFPSEPRVATNAAAAAVRVSLESRHAPEPWNPHAEDRSIGSRNPQFAANVAHGSALMFLDPRMALVCLPLLPACIATIAIISALADGGSKPRTVVVDGDAWDDGSGRAPATQSQSARMAAAISGKLRETDFGRRLTPRLAPADGDAVVYPRIVVHLRAANLRAQGNTVQFQLEASAQGQSSADELWSTTEHSILSPKRHAKDWLAADGTQLRQDLEAALDALGAHVAKVYAPELP